MCLCFCICDSTDEYVKMRLQKWNGQVTDFMIEKWTLNHKDQHDFYMCQWQNKQKVVNKYYMIYRICFALLMITLNVSSFFAGSKNDPPEKEDAKYFIFITNWGFIMITVQGVLGMIVVVQKYFEMKKGFNYDHILLNKLYWAFHNVALDVAPNITLAYWKFVYNPAVDMLNFSNFSVHIFNTVITFVDFWLVAFPTRLVHVYFSLIFGTVYTVFNIVYVMSGGTDRNSNPYIYKILSFKDNFAKAFMWATAILLFLLIWRLIYFGLYLLKRKIYTACKSNKVLPSPIHM